MTKVKNLKLGAKVKKPISLADQIERDSFAKPSEKLKINRSKSSAVEDEYIGGTISKKIINQGKALHKELHIEDRDEFPTIGGGVKKHRKDDSSKPMAVSFSRTSKNQKMAFINQKKDENESDSDDAGDIDEFENAVPFNVDQITKELTDALDIDPMDQDILEHFSKMKNKQSRLADIFKDKVTEIQTEVDAQSQIGHQSTIDPRVVELCKELGEILSRYRSGKLPKILKSFHQFVCWEELVYLTNPDNWTAAAMYQGTRIFISSLNSAMAQRFVRLVLLPRIRDDIAFYKRLNYHLFQAMMKALFKPAAFFKGIVFPLCEGGNCSLREAIIVGSVIAKNSIPIAHSCAAIKIISGFPYSGPNSIFLRILFDKKYALPYQVIDEVYDHFMRFENESKTLPVLWHQALMTFIQRYKNDLSMEQRDDFRRLVGKQTHFKISPQIERELQHATGRGDIGEEMNVDP